MISDERIIQLIVVCKTNRKNVFGTRYIFEKRAIKFSRYINLLKVFGIATPALVGISLLSYGFDSLFVHTLFWIAAAIMIIQFFFSVLAIIYKWDDELSYCYDAMQDHDYLHESFSQLINFSDNEYQQLKNDFDLINTKKKSRDFQDFKHNAKEWELRKGARYANKFYKEKCEVCQIIPVDMHSTDCPGCGRFSFKYKLKAFFGYE